MKVEVHHFPSGPATSHAIGETYYPPSAAHSILIETGLSFGTRRLYEFLLLESI